MTTEDDFQAALDKDRTDHQIRLVFADWLEERGDERAAGYRVMGYRGFYPYLNSVGNYVVSNFQAPGPDCSQLPDRSNLPTYWLHFVSDDVCGVFGGQWISFPSRREAEDAVARAFTRMAPSIRARLIISTTTKKRRTTRSLFK